MGTPRSRKDVSPLLQYHLAVAHGMHPGELRGLAEKEPDDVLEILVKALGSLTKLLAANRDNKATDDAIFQYEEIVLLAVWYFDSRKETNVFNALRVRVE